MNRYFYQKNPWWENTNFESGIPRTQYIDQLVKNFPQKLIQIVTGLRRVGKSTIVLQLIKHLIQKQKIDPKKILFFSIEEPSIFRLPIIEIINQFRAEHNIRSNTKIYVFIDEIQFRKNWEQQIKSLYDSENIKFILTGSSAMLLSEKLSYLTGRYLKTRVYPLDFLEYLRFKKVEVSKVDSFLLHNHVRDFLTIGGMPEFVLYKTDRYLQTTVESILFKDLVSKFQLRNPQVLTDLLYLLSDRVGSTSSSVKLSHILQVNKDTTLTYIDYLDKTFITAQLSNYSTSRNKKIYNPAKVYFEDTGIANTYASKTNFGALAENAVFNFLSRVIQDTLRVEFGYWYENVSEIDFVVRKGDNIFLIESKWIDSIEEVNLKPLHLALKILNPSKVLYVTKSLELKTKIDNFQVEFLPLDEFLRSKKWFEKVIKF